MLPTNIARVPNQKANPGPAIVGSFSRAGLIPQGQVPICERLVGGVSSDIWLVRVGGMSFCVKQALSRLRVAADWQAPVERNAREVAWMRAVAGFMPEAVPAVLAADAGLGVFAMQYLPPDTYEVWKSRLRQGLVSTATATQVGERLARVHATFAKSATAPDEFDTDAIFHSLRIEPYLLATARAHPDLRVGVRRSGRNHRAHEDHAWCTATSARRTSWSDRRARCSSTRNAPGSAIQRSIWPSASITCC